jgi:hypothetical protein
MKAHRADLWEVRQAAADRRSGLRSAFIRQDPQLSGQIAPFLVKHIIDANKIDVPTDFRNQFTCAPRLSQALMTSTVPAGLTPRTVRRRAYRHAHAAHAANLALPVNATTQVQWALPLDGLLPRARGAATLVYESRGLRARHAPFDDAARRAAVAAPPARAPAL